MIALLPLLLACTGSEAPWTSATWEDPGVAAIPADTGAAPTPAAAPVVINEVVADNDSVAQDEHGDKDDWIELYARQAVDLSGFTLADDSAAWTFPAGTTLAAGERLVLWADADPDQGSLHLPFRLSASGETLTLADADGAVLDQWELPATDTDLARARFPDGGDRIATSIRATPGLPNPWEPGPESDPSQLLFPDDDVVVVELFLPDDSLAALTATPYDYVRGSIAFDGVALHDIGIRRKGQAGSLRDMDEKAAFKVSLDAFGGDARLRGLENLTLNNMVQDHSFVHELMAYALFRDRGVPAPRTAHAAVYLNGEYRGLYLHVETADDTFLGRWYDNPEGNLYEGEYGEDVTLDSYTRLEQDERGSDDPDDYSDLAALAEFLEQEPDEALVPELETLIDVDEVLTMLAVEVVIGHWDGYFWYPNNYRVYHDPDSGRLSLLPWGVDQTFDYEGDPLQIDGALAAWMLEIPSLRAAYLRELETAVTRMEALALDELALEAHQRIVPWVDAGPYEETTVEGSLDELHDARTYVQTRGATIADFLDGVR